MTEISVIGIDLAKRVFQLCALSGTGEVVWEKRLNRAGFLKFIETAPACVVGMEACGGAHHWGRWFARRGCLVKLLAPQAVKAYRTGVHKNDGRDARAVAEAASRGYLAAVPVKSATAQAAQAAMRVRERQIRQLVQTANQMRGLLNEFGIVLPKGRQRLLARVAELIGGAAFQALPPAMQALVRVLQAEIVEQAAKVRDADRVLAAAVAADASCTRLRTIPNLGPVTTAGLAVALEQPAAFRNGRAFAAALRLVPRQHASAETNRQRGVGRLRHNELRRYLVLAAQSLLTRVARLTQPPEDALLAWAQRLLRCKPRNVAAVAVAGKLARIAWAVLAGGQRYTPRRAIG